jgi:hypothetical protein
MGFSSIEVLLLVTANYWELTQLSRRWLENNGTRRPHHQHLIQRGSPFILDLVEGSYPKSGIELVRALSNAFLQPSSSCQCASSPGSVGLNLRDSNGLDFRMSWNLRCVQIAS